MLKCLYRPSLSRFCAVSTEPPCTVHIPEQNSRQESYDAQFPWSGIDRGPHAQHWKLTLFFCLKILWVYVHVDYQEIVLSDIWIVTNKLTVNFYHSMLVYPNVNGSAKLLFSDLETVHRVQRARRTLHYQWNSPTRTLWRGHFHGRVVMT